MPAIRRLIDPDTRDYVVVNGRPVSDPTHGSEVLLRLAMRLGSSAADGSVGSKISTIRTLTPQSPSQAELFAIEALQPMVARKAISGVSAVATVDGTSMTIEVAFTDSVSGQPETITHRVG